MNADHGHLPTRTCPHRQCTLVHHLVLLMLLPGLLTAVIYGGAPTAVLLVLLGGIQLGVILLTHALDPAPRPWEYRPLVVRPVWAAFAIVTDILGLIGALALMAALAFDTSYAAVPSPTPGTLITLGAISGLLALHHIAHRRATVTAEPAADDDDPDDDWMGESFIWEPGDLATYSK
ncbi:hypothetical protein AB0393_27925 [Streptomyces cyaneofuscatus]|uniref:hypothetical protein n=1 Tax=Streptomyces cyaneofuscatus TaxID=66883 RepID=UPI00344FD65E